MKFAISRLFSIFIIAFMMTSCTFIEEMQDIDLSDIDYFGWFSSPKVNNDSFNAFIALYDSTSLPLKIQERELYENYDLRTDIDSLSIHKFINRDKSFSDHQSINTVYKFKPYKRIHLDGGKIALITIKIFPSAEFDDKFILSLHEKSGKRLSKAIIASLLGDCKRLTIEEAYISEIMSVSISKRQLFFDRNCDELMLEMPMENRRLTLNNFKWRETIEEIDSVIVVN